MGMVIPVVGVRCVFRYFPNPIRSVEGFVRTPWGIFRAEGVFTGIGLTVTPQDKIVEKHLIRREPTPNAD